MNTMLAPREADPTPAAPKKARKGSEPYETTVPPVSPLALEVGTKLRRVRESKGITRKAASKALGLSPQQLGKYEFGTSILTLEKLLQYANYLNMPLMTFLPADVFVSGTAYSKRLFDLFMEVETLPEKKRNQIIGILDKVLDAVEP